MIFGLRVSQLMRMSTLKPEHGEMSKFRGLSILKQGRRTCIKLIQLGISGEFTWNSSLKDRIILSLRTKL